ncbi:MAG: DUF1800 domain-containing protein [Actinomycetota bacterium]|nr:DUF1800 domain-containing protein [Actinomycetota bacterium]
MPSRRSLVVGSAAVATAAATSGAFTQRAAAAATYPVNPYLKTPIPTPADLHMMNRMGCGYSRGTWAEVAAAGGADAWFEQQLDPDSVPENALTGSLLSWFPDLLDDPTVKWRRHQADTKGGWEYAKDLANYTMLRRMYSSRQVLENMVDFWSNHMHVPARVDVAWVQRYDYDLLIRRLALGRFEDLLVETTLHPSMLIYLDNYKSVRNAPNENHGRELLELHTVGRASGYTEQMVKDSAKILSGYSVHAKESWEPFYDSANHTTGAVNVLGFSDANASSDGRELTKRYLRYLANHPATARTIANKLALRFVSDEPSDELVTHLASVFQSSGTDIRATLRALVSHAEFRASAGTKVRTPIEDLIATSRVLQVAAQKPTGGAAFAHLISYVHQSLILYQWPRPDGPPDRNSAWASASRVLSSFRMHWLLAGGFHPDNDVVYRTPKSWIPQRSLRFDRYVDHLCRMLHGRPSTSQVLKAAVESTGLSPSTVVTREHRIAGYLGVRLIGALLDSPVHMSR